jgi:hypothetical protein
VASSYAFSGAWADITDKPTFAPVATSGTWGDITGKPAFAPVATSGAYEDLSGAPDLSAFRDQQARDQLALTNLRLLLASSLSSGALVAGQQWDLVGTLTGFSITALTHSGSGSIPYLTNAETTTLGPSGWSAAAGTTYSPASSLSDGTTAEATATGTTAFVGIAGNGASPQGYTLTCSTSDGFGSGNPTVTVRFLGALSADPSTGTVLHTTTFTDPLSATQAERTFSAAFSSAEIYPFYYLQLSAPSSVTWRLSGVTWQMLKTTSGAIVSPSVSVAEVPSSASAYFLWSSDDGDISELSVMVSRDGAITPVSASPQIIASYDGSWSLVKAEAAFAETAPGSSVSFRITFGSSNRHRFAAPALYVG